MEQFYFVIAVLVIGFLNWVVKKFQESRQAQDEETLRREMETMDPKLREEMERRNTQAPPPRPAESEPQGPAQPAPQGNQLRDLMSELLGIPQETKSAPPPLPVQPAAPAQHTKKQTRSDWTPKARPKLSEAEKRAMQRFREADRRQGRRRRGAGDWGALRKLIAEPGGLQKAVVLREILGPPQSLK